MNKLDLRSFNKMSYEQMRYISDNAEICVDYMISDTHTPTEILCAKMEANLIYLSNLNKDSLEYIYSKFSWAIEILEFHDFNSEDDFYRKLKDTFDIDKDRVPDCIKEVLKAITDKVLHAKIYKEGEMVYKYNNDQIKFLELYPSEIEEISKLMNIQLENDTLRSIDMEEDVTLMSFTTKFKDSLEADIKICTGDTNCFIDPVLYEHGCEVAIMDCEGEFY